MFISKRIKRILQYLTDFVTIIGFASLLGFATFVTGAFWSGVLDPTHNMSFFQKAGLITGGVTMSSIAFIWVAEQIGWMRDK